MQVTEIDLDAQDTITLIVEPKRPLVSRGPLTEVELAIARSIAPPDSAHLHDDIVKALDEGSPMEQVDWEDELPLPDFPNPDYC